MTDKIQPGGRIDPRVWKRFKKFAEHKHNRKRGILGEELEKALVNHMNGEEPESSIDRIEGDVAQNKVLLSEIHEALADPDGGTVAPAPSPSNDDSTHIDTDDQDDKPHPKATVDEKVEWLIGEDFFPGRESGVFLRADLYDEVRKRYALSDDAVERMADAMLTKVGAKDTPHDNALLAWGDQYDSFKEQAREEAREEAEADFGDLDDAERGDR